MSTRSARRRPIPVADPQPGASLDFRGFSIVADPLIPPAAAP